MTDAPTVALLAPLHDPDGALADEVERALGATGASGAWRLLQQSLAGATAVVSRRTALATREAFERLGLAVQTEADGPADAFMWRLVETALRTSVTHVLLIDADRLLHWLLAYPEGLASLPERWGRHDVLTLARSPRAFATHPPCLRLTEGPAQRLIAQTINVPGADPFSGAYLRSRRALQSVARSDAPRDGSFYAEIFLAPAAAGCTFDTLACEGLEWETPDRFRAAIATQGYQQWLASYETPAEWRRRAHLAGLWIARVIAYRQATLRGR